jgi:7-keto-8-aminopelargonate synthetase-like enzyme
VLSDKLNHASILDAVRSCGADFRTYPHRDTARLQRLLERRRGGARQCVIVTDTLFSMDGDLAPLAELTDLKRRYDAVLLVDEAHATGVLGKHGRGAADLAGVEDGVDVVVGTLSKALGALGGFVAGPEVLIQTLRNTARPYIYTTAPPPAVCAAAMAALEIVQAEPQRRRKLLAMAEALRRNLADLGLDPGDSASQVVPVVLGDARRAVSVSRGLLGAGFLVPAIRPPTVPRGSSRLRVSLCSGHDQADLTRFAETLARSLDEHDSGA